MFYLIITPQNKTKNPAEVETSARGVFASDEYSREGGELIALVQTPVANVASARVFHFARLTVVLTLHNVP